MKQTACTRSTIRRLFLYLLILFCSSTAMAQQTPRVTLYGLTLGEKLTLPNCQLPARLANARALQILPTIRTTCVIEHLSTSEKGAYNNVIVRKVIALPADWPFPWLDYNFIMAELDPQSGTIIGLGAGTRGIAVQEEVVHALTMQLGPPSSLTDGTDNPLMVASPGSIEAQWLFNRSGISITFTGEAGESANNRTGMIHITMKPPQRAQPPASAPYRYAPTGIPFRSY